MNLVPMDEAFTDALEKLSQPVSLAPGDRTAAPTAPGLYALHASAAGLAALGLSHHPVDRAIYVGKSQSSLRTRTLGTHFRTGRTGHSTVRRSLAALLQDNLDLTVAQRPGKGHPSYFAPATPGDERLTEWRFAHLRLACWPCPDELPIPALKTDLTRQ